MKKALFTIGALIVLIVAAVGVEKLYCYNTVLNQKPAVTNAESGDSARNTEKPLAATPEANLGGANAANKKSTNDHQSNNKGQNEFLLWGLKAGDWIAIFFGLVAIFFSWRGLRQNRISNEKQNRAYVFIQKCLVSQIPEGYKVSIKFVNGGATPANDIRGNIWLSYSNDHNAEPTREHIPFPVRPIYLAPTDFKTVEIGVSGEDFPMEMRQGLLDGSISLMMFGEITYSDQFGNNQKMTFRFRRRVGSGSFFGQMIVAGRGLIST